MKPKKKPLSERLLNMVEKYGNALPQPTTLFVILALLVVVSSHAAYLMGATTMIPQLDQETGAVKEILVSARSLLIPEGIRYMFESAVTNFTGFAPVGVVLVSLFGVAAADGSGLLKALIKKILYGIDEKYITAMVVFIGVMSNVASDSGYVVVLPLGAMIFKSMGKNPIAGIAAGFAGVSGGFSANLLLGSIDPLLGNLTTMGASVVDPSYMVSPTANYYFMVVSTLLVTLVGTFVTQKIVEPRLEKTEGSEKVELEALAEEERKGLKYALVALLASIALLMVLILPEGAILRNQADGNILTNSPFINSIVIVITLLFLIPGIFFGIGAGTIRSDKDLLRTMEGMLNTMGGYLILTFVAAQFVAYFRYSNLGTISSCQGCGSAEADGPYRDTSPDYLDSDSGLHQPVHRIGRDQMEHYGTGVRSHVLHAGYFPGAHSVGLSSGGFLNESDFTADAVFRNCAFHRLHVQKRHRNRNNHVHHDALFLLFTGELDCALCAVDRSGHSHRTWRDRVFRGDVNGSANG